MRNRYQIQQIIHLQNFRNSWNLSAYEKHVEKYVSIVLALPFNHLTARVSQKNSSFFSFHVASNLLVATSFAVCFCLLAATRNKFARINDEKSKRQTELIALGALFFVVVG